MTASRVAVLLASGAAILGGCGGGGSGGDGKPVSDPQAVTAAVTGFTRAFGAGDGAKACDLLTPAGRAAFLKRVSGLAGATDCPTAMKRLHDSAGSQVTSAFASATVGAVNVSGVTATAQLTASGHSTTARLIKTGGEWKLTAIPGT